MISKQDILKMTRVVTRQSNGYHVSKIVHPNRDWLVGVVLFIIVATIGGIINARTHVTYNTLETQVGQTPGTHTEYNINQADVALTIFQQRQRNFEALTNEIVPVPIPVIQAEEQIATSTEGVVVEETPNDSVLIQE